MPMQWKKVGIGILGFIIALILPLIIAFLGIFIEDALRLPIGFLENFLLGWVKIIGLPINLIIASFLYKTKKTLAIGMIIGTIVILPVMFLPWMLPG